MTEQIDIMLTQMDLASLNALIARATELRDQRHTEAMDRLQQEAVALGATVKMNGHKTRRRRGSKHHDSA